MAAAVLATSIRLSRGRVRGVRHAMRFNANLLGVLQRAGFATALQSLFDGLAIRLEGK